MNQVSPIKVLILAVIGIIAIPVTAYTIWHFGVKAYNKVFSIESDEEKVIRLQHNNKILKAHSDAVVSVTEIKKEKNITTIVVRHEYEKNKEVLVEKTVDIKKELNKSIHKIKRDKPVHITIYKKKKSHKKVTKDHVASETVVSVDRGAYNKAGFLFILTMNRAYNNAISIKKKDK